MRTPGTHVILSIYFLVLLYRYASCWFGWGFTPMSVSNDDWKWKRSILLWELFYRFDGSHLKRYSWIKIMDNMLYARFIIPHLHEWGNESHIRSIFLHFVRCMFGKIDWSLEIYDDFLCRLFSDSWDRWEKFIIFELDGSHEILSTEAKEIQGGFSSDTIHFEELTKQFFFFQVCKSKECLPRFIDMMMNKNLWLFSYANIRKNYWRGIKFDSKTSSLYKQRDLDTVDWENISGKKWEHYYVRLGFEFCFFLGSNFLILPKSVFVKKSKLMQQKKNFLILLSHEKYGDLHFTETP